MITEINDINEGVLKGSYIEEANVLEDIKNNPFSKVLVCINNNEIMGYLYYSEIYDRIEINNIEVLPSYRGQGFGKKLLEHLITKGKDITLEVDETNNIAISLYKSVGFKEVAKREGYYNGKDGILMLYEKK